MDIDSETEEPIPEWEHPWDLSSPSKEEVINQLMLQEAAPLLADACELLHRAAESPGRSGLEACFRLHGWCEHF